MYVKCRPLALVYRGLIGFLSIIATWSLFVMLGVSAWRLFITWVVIFSSIYYISSTIIAILVGGRKSVGWTPAPTWQLATLVASGSVMAEGIMGEGVAEVHGQIGFLIRVLLPILTIADWLAFSKKGQLRMVDPWYALALPACYAAWILMTADMTRQTWAYPYQNFEIAAVGVPTMLWWLVLLATIVVLSGYAIYVLDFVMSGRLSKYIVMPKIKLIEVVDDPVVQKPTEETKMVGTKPTEIITPRPVADKITPKTSIKNIPVKKTMDVAQTKPVKKPTKVIETEKNAKPAETVAVVKKSKPLASEKEVKTEQKNVISVEKRPSAPVKPEEPKVPQIPQIENRKKDKKSAQNLHGKK